MIFMKKKLETKTKRSFFSRKCFHSGKLILETNINVVKGYMCLYESLYYLKARINTFFTSLGLKKDFKTEAQ